jgi:transposase-like protein
MISQLNERLWQGYETFCQADLSGYDLVYLFADAVYESLRLHQSRKEGILVVWGILASGAKVLLTMKLGNKESFDDWQEVFRDLRKRGLPEPVLGTTDGAPGLIQAFEAVFPKSLRQRCLVHKKRNILAKVPEEAVPALKAHLNGVYHAADLPTAHAQAQRFREQFQAHYPSAVACFEEDLAACLAHLRCPPRHRKFISSTNMVERGFLEEKRRSGTIPRFFTEQSGLKLVFATLSRAAQTWRRVEITFDEQMQLLQLRQQLGLRAPHEPKLRKNHRGPRKPRPLSSTKGT